jgi:hypothetical protein
MDFQIKYEKILKIEEKNLYIYILLFIIDGDSNFIQFYYRLIVYERPLI